jgi:hypothetical protein
MDMQDTRPTKPLRSHGPRAHRRAIVAGLAAVLALPASALAEPGESDTTDERAVVGEEAQKPSRFAWQGEELYFSIRLNGAEAMRAALRVGKMRTVGGHRLVPVAGMARSMGFFEKVYPVDDHLKTFLDPQTSRPLHSTKVFDERNKYRKYQVDYVHSTYRARVQKYYHNRESDKRRRRRYIKAIPGTTHDMVSWMYELRSEGNLRVGKTFSFYVYDGWKLSRIDAVVRGKEDVYTPMGWFKGWKIAFEREVLRSKARHVTLGEGDKKRRIPREPLLRVRTPSKRTGELWLSRDENLVPFKVRLVSKMGVGEAFLMKYTPSLSARARISGAESGERACVDPRAPSVEGHDAGRARERRVARTAHSMLRRRERMAA